MNDDTWQIIALAVATLAQAYYVEPWKFNVLGWFWDMLARITGIIANHLAKYSVRARYNYFVTVGNAS